METPETLEECLDVEGDFQYNRNKRDMTLRLNSIDEYKYSKFIGRPLKCFLLNAVTFVIRYNSITEPNLFL